MSYNSYQHYCWITRRPNTPLTAYLNVVRNDTGIPVHKHYTSYLNHLFLNTLVKRSRIKLD